MQGHSAHDTGLPAKTNDDQFLMMEVCITVHAC